MSVKEISEESYNQYIANLTLGKALRNYLLVMLGWPIAQIFSFFKNCLFSIFTLAFPGATARMWSHWYFQCLLIREAYSMAERELVLVIKKKKKSSSSS